VRLKRVETIDSSNFTLYPGEVSVSENHSWHRCVDRFYGNVAHVSAGAPAGEDRVHTHTTYACRDDAGGYIVDKPVDVQVRDVADTVTLEEKWFLYDGLGNLPKGNVTRAESWIEQWTGANLCTAGGGKRCVRTTMGTMPSATSPR
jgi:hypothetical protein